MLEYIAGVPLVPTDEARQYHTRLPSTTALLYPLYPIVPPGTTNLRTNQDVSRAARTAGENSPTGAGQTG